MRIRFMKKYLLLIEDEKLWEKFKNIIDKDINTEIINLIKKKIGLEVKK
jgi:hypothetical protein